MAPKVVVITGCSSGIGLSTAVLLASDKEGRFKVFATMRNLAKQDKLKTAAGDTLDKTLFIRQLDVTKEDSIIGFVQKINKEEGGVDILINNAGVAQNGVVENVSMQEIRSVFETNVFGLIRLTQEVIPGMKTKKSGHIINVSSVVALWGIPFCEIYIASKAAVEGFTESIAAYLQQFNISVSLIEPGPVATEIMAKTGENTPGDSGSPKPNTDDFTMQLMKTSTDAMNNLFFSMIQQASDVASVIQEAILSDKPHLRYPTSEAGVEAFVAKKYKDSTGDSIVKAIVAQNGWAK